MRQYLSRLIVTLAIFLAPAGSLNARAQTQTPPPIDPVIHDPAPAAPQPPAAHLPGLPPLLAPAAPPLDEAQADAAQHATLGRPGLYYSYRKTLGTTGQPYVVDTRHLNTPTGLFIDAADNVYVVENEGSRLLRFNPGGQVTLNLGRAGMHYAARDNFAWPQDVAVDGDGHIWVVEEGRVAQFDADGSFLQALPASIAPCLPDDGHFCRPGGIAFEGSQV